MDKMFTLFAAPTNTVVYEANPLDANVVFGLGQLAIVIVLCLLVLCGIIGFIARVTGLTRLDIETEKWTSRFAIAFLYTVLIWLGLSMIVSYFGSSLLDTINGVALLSGALISIIQRASSNQTGANRTLAFSFVFVVAIIIWNFIYGAVMNALPASFLEAIGNELHGDFITHAMRWWGWM